MTVIARCTWTAPAPLLLTLVQTRRLVDLSLLPGRCWWRCCPRSSPTGLEINAMRRLPTRVFGILMSLEPAGAAVAGLIVLHQRLGLREIVALLLVSVASLGVTWAHRGLPG